MRLAELTPRVLQLQFGGSLGLTRGPELAEKLNLLAPTKAGIQCVMAWVTWQVGCFWCLGCSGTRMDDFTGTLQSTGRTLSAGSTLIGQITNIGSKL